MSGNESDYSESSQGSQGSQFSSVSQGYNADDELDELIEKDVFDRDTINNEEEKLEQKIVEEREKAKAELTKEGKKPEDIEKELTKREYFEEYEEEERASQVVNTLKITINETEKTVDVTPEVVPSVTPEVVPSVTPEVVPSTGKRIRAPAAKYYEYLQEKTIKEAEKEAKKQAPPTPPPEPPTSLNASFDSQIATDQLQQDSLSQATVAKSIIIDNIRLEAITPDSQAKKIFTNEELTAMKLCYLCGCKFEDRISAKHNQRWGYTNNPITRSYDHTLPVNFSMVVFRVPSSYVTQYTEDEKEYLKLNGKMACFHCNYTKSQRMFITCPKTKDGKIVFKNFAPNDKAIKKFIDDLWNSESKWNEGLDVSNTLHQCVGNDEEDIRKWKRKRFDAIKASVNEVCEMIKKNVNQNSVLKRLYYIKLLIAKARELLKEDLYFNNEEVKASRRKAYGNRFIVDLIYKAEATDPKFEKPWGLETILEEEEKNSQDESMVSQSSNNLSIKRPLDNKTKGKQSKTPRITPIGSSRKRKQTRKQKNKRKTYRRIRLF